MRRHVERHLIERIGWLRAAILGANDGIISTASLMVGVASASSPASQILLTGIAGLVAGSMSMAAGEYVSVSSQADTEKADLARERAELAATPAEETTELANIYVSRGVESVLARQVAIQLMAQDSLAAQAKD
jgi:VIT1/CCC1 family predicted Fe2+/Mn2+ transporter